MQGFLFHWPLARIRRKTGKPHLSIRPTRIACPSHRPCRVACVFCRIDRISRRGLQKVVGTRILRTRIACSSRRPYLVLCVSCRTGRVSRRGSQKKLVGRTRILLRTRIACCSRRPCRVLCVFTEPAAFLATVRKTWSFPAPCFMLALSLHPFLEA